MNLRVLLPMAALAVGLDASAHRLSWPKKVDLTIEPGRAVVTIRYDVEDEEAPEYRRRFDADADGTLNQDEGDALASFLAKEAWRNLVFQANGVEVALHPTSTSGHRTEGPADAHAHLGVTVVIEGALPDAPVLALRLADADPRGPRGVPLRVSWKGMEADAARDAMLRAGAHWEGTLRRKR